MLRLPHCSKSQLFLSSVLVLSLTLSSPTSVLASKGNSSVQSNIDRLKQEAATYEYDQAIAKQKLFNIKQEAEEKRLQKQQAREEREARKKALKELHAEQLKALKKYKEHRKKVSLKQYKDNLDSFQEKLQDIENELQTLGTEESTISSSIANDGQAMDYPYCDSGAESTYTDKDGDDLVYYDVAVPYKLKVSDVGGIAIGVESIKPAYRYDSSYKCSYGTYADSHLGCKILTENKKLRYSLAPKGIDAETGLPVYEAFGTKLYGIALGAGYLPDFVEDLGFHSYNYHTMTHEGVLCDLYLTDGTIIHCVVCDAIGRGHSNARGLHDGWTATSVSTAQDGVRYKMSNLRMPQYKYFVHAASCHSVEIFGDGNKFMKHFGIRGDGSGNAIAYVRIYGANLAESDVNVKSQYSNIVTRN